MAPGIWQILIIVVLVVLLFGAGRISGLMGEVAKGITSFRKGLKEGAEGDDAADKDTAGTLSDDRSADDAPASREEETTRN
ncbi:twin-arginine translocase TatA/TatE family subunit [Hyphobacterium sp.]|jgi:sec-independent protein translocase protein TatA|uniref:twin-arginine translocase TatA/TatE family subunit n=1 Tax=Hyphobacterium sp. TaxID=2004662 RepID=UPI003BA864BA